MASKKKLPKTLFAYRFLGSGDDNWINAEECAEDCAERGEKRIVGVYELKSTLAVSLEVKKEVKIKKIRTGAGRI